MEVGDTVVVIVGESVLSVGVLMEGGFETVLPVEGARVSAPPPTDGRLDGTEVGDVK